MNHELVALKTFSDSIGSVQAGAIFKAPQDYARNLIESGFARIASAGDAFIANAPWSGSTVVVIGSGTSVTQEDLLRVRDWRAENPSVRKVIVINLTFRDALWADMLYGADDLFWDVFNEEIQRTFAGEKWTQSDHARRNYGINFVQCERREGLSRLPGVINHGGSSGYQGIGLAYHMGAVKIILLGFDMQRIGSKVHYHKGYPKGKGFNVNSPLEKWAGMFGSLYRDLKNAGVIAINASPRTSISNFARGNLDDALKDTVIQKNVPSRAYSMLKPTLHYRRQIFSSGLSKIGCSMRDGEPRTFNEDMLLLIWNRYHQNHELARRVEDAGGIVVVAENGYVAENGGTPKFDGGTYAIALNGHNGIGRWTIGGPDRWNALGITIKPWQNGEHILVCPNRTFGQPGFIMPSTWANEIVHALRAFTDRPIIVRPHPGNHPPEIPLAAQLENAWAVVIWSSSAGVHALIEGVPVFQCGPKWICSGAASHDLDIENPRREGRVEALHALAWAQWNYQEIESGKAFRHLLGLEK